MMKCFELPVPGEEALDLSGELLGRICREIGVGGPMTFARFMEMALYEPGLGYYRNGLQKFGEGGDFVTAPLLSPLFSRCVAKQCAEVLDSLGGGDVLELGAGSGVMAADMLLALEGAQKLPDHYYILELSRELQERQRECIAQKAPQLLSRVEWLSRLPEPAMRGVVVANEVLDAMPVHQFCIRDGELRELFVDWKGDELVWGVGEPSCDELVRRVRDLGVDFAEGYQSEINLMLPAWLKSLVEHLERGYLLFMDYGFLRQEYYHHDRREGTLMCHYRHRAHSNPLIWPGLQDITAHVDFTTVLETAESLGLSVDCYDNQANFLINCGIIDMLRGLDDELELYQLKQQIKRLTLPSEMGELVKVAGVVV